MLTPSAKYLENQLPLLSEESVHLSTRRTHSLGPGVKGHLAAWPEQEIRSRSALSQVRIVTSVEFRIASYELRL
jgi:hypothetical protein